MGKLQRNINIFFALAFTIYTAYSIFYQQAGMFFIIYLFWFDEVIRNLSLLIQYRLSKKRVPEEMMKDRAAGIGSVKARFFFLFVYSVFIVIAFGIFFHLDKGSRDALFENLTILMFRHPVFNLCLAIALVREIIIIRTQFIHKSLPVVTGPMNGHMITLHLSILLGGCMFVLTGNTHSPVHISLGAATPYAIAVPFLVIKLIVDLYNANGPSKFIPVSVT